MSRRLSDISVISAPLDQGPHEVQSQLVPKFSHAFFLSTHLWVFAKHLINLCQIHHFWQKFAFFENSVIVKVAFFVISFEFCSNLSCYILPKFAIFAKIKTCKRWEAAHLHRRETFETFYILHHWGDFFQGSYSWKFERWYRFYIADQDTARYNLCSAMENCVSWAEPLKLLTDNLFSSRVFLLNL